MAKDSTKKTKREIREFRDLPVIKPLDGVACNNKKDERCKKKKHIKTNTTVLDVIADFIELLVNVLEFR